jgi:hypothetical protein
MRLPKFSLRLLIVLQTAACAVLALQKMFSLSTAIILLAAVVVIAHQRDNPKGILATILVALLVSELVPIIHAILVPGMPLTVHN